MRRVWLVTTLSFLMLGGPLSADKLAVHIPSHRAESAGRLAASVDRLAADLGARLEIELEPVLFRRLEDLEAFLSTSDETTLLLTDASFLDGDTHGFEPGASFVVDGADTYARVVVVPTDSPAERLADLRGEVLTVVRTTANPDYFGTRIFAGELDPATYFSGLREVIEDNEAVTDLLFGQSGAALVAEHTPLLQDSLGSKLRIVYRSRPLPLPVLSVRSGGNPSTAELVAALGRVDPASEWLAGLGIDGFRPLAQALHADPDSERTVLWTLEVPSLVGPAPKPPVTDLPLPYYLPLPEPRPVAEDILSAGEPESR